MNMSALGEIIAKMAKIMFTVKIYKKEYLQHKWDR